MTTTDIPRVTRDDLQDTSSDDIGGIVPHGTITYRLARLTDELHIVAMFSAMLRELEPLGHDVLPTERNLDTYWQHVFRRALLEERHGIVLAFADGQPVGVSFFTPNYAPIDTLPSSAVAHGLWVHPEWRRQGVAWRLQAIAHGRLAQLGFTRLMSNVLLSNRPGVANCSSLGYDYVGFIVSLNLKEAM